MCLLCDCIEKDWVDTDRWCVCCVIALRMIELDTDSWCVCCVIALRRIELDTDSWCVCCVIALRMIELDTDSWCVCFVIALRRIELTQTVDVFAVWLHWEGLSWHRQLMCLLCDCVEEDWVGHRQLMCLLCDCVERGLSWHRQLMCLLCDCVEDDWVGHRQLMCLLCDCVEDDWVGHRQLMCLLCDCVERGLSWHRQLMCLLCDCVEDDWVGHRQLMCLLCDCVEDDWVGHRQLMCLLCDCVEGGWVDTDSWCVCCVIALRRIELTQTVDVFAEWLRWGGLSWTQTVDVFAVWLRWEGVELTQTVDAFAVWLRWGGLSWHRQLMCLLCDCVERGLSWHRQLMRLLCDCAEEDWVDTDSWCVCCVIALRRIELDTDSWCVCCVIALRRIELTQTVDAFAVWLCWEGLSWHRQLMCLLCDCDEDDWVGHRQLMCLLCDCVEGDWVGHRQLICLLCDCIEGDWVDKGSWCVCCVIALRGTELTQTVDVFAVWLRWGGLSWQRQLMCLLCDCVEGGWVDKGSWCVCCVIALKGTKLTQTVDVFAVWLRWGGLSWQRQLMCLLCDCVEGDWVDTDSWCVCCVIALRGVELTKAVDVFTVWLRWRGLSWHRQLMCLLCDCVEGGWVDKGSWCVCCVIALKGTELTQTVDVFAVWLHWGGLSWHRQLMCLLCDCIEGDWVDTYIWCVCCVIALRGIELTQTVDVFAVWLRWGGLNWQRQLMCLLCDCVEGIELTQTVDVFAVWLRWWDWADTDSWCVYCVIALRGIELTQTVDVFAVWLRWGGLSWHRQFMCLLCDCVEGDWVDTGSSCVYCVIALRGIELTQTVDVFAVWLRWGGLNWQRQLMCLLCDCVEGIELTQTVDVFAVWLCWWDWADTDSWCVYCVIALRGIELTQTVDVFAVWLRWGGLNWHRQLMCLLCDCVDGIELTQTVDVFTVWLRWGDWVDTDSWCVCCVIALRGVELTKAVDVFTVWLRWRGLSWHRQLMCLLCDCVEGGLSWQRQLMCLLCDCVEGDWVDTDGWCVCCVIALRGIELTQTVDVFTVWLHWGGLSWHIYLMCLLCDCIEGDWVDTDSWCVCCVIALMGLSWHRQLMCLLCDCVEGIELTQTVDVFAVWLHWGGLNWQRQLMCLLCDCVEGIELTQTVDGFAVWLRWWDWADTDSWCVYCVIALRGIELTQTVDVFAVWLRWGGLSLHRQLMCLLCDCVEGIELTQTVDVFAVWLRWWDWADTDSWCVYCVIALRGLSWHRQLMCLLYDCVDGIELTQTVDVFTVWLRWGGLSWHRQLMCLLCDCIEGDWVDTDSWCVCCVIALTGIELTQTVDVFAVWLRWGGLSWHRQLMCLLCDCVEWGWVYKGSWCVYCVIALRGIELTQTVDVFAVWLHWRGLSWHRQLMCLLCDCVEGDLIDKGSWCVCCVIALRGLSWHRQLMCLLCDCVDGIELTQTVDVFTVWLHWGGLSWHIFDVFAVWLHWVGLSWHRQLMCLLYDCVEGDWVDTDSWCVCCVIALRGVELTKAVDVFAVWLRWGGLSWHRQLMCLLCDCIEGGWVDTDSWCVCCVIALRGVELTQTVDVFAVWLRWGGLSWHR